MRWKSLNPKMYALDSATPPVPVVANSDEINMEAQVKRINESKFTSKGDHSKVVQLYQDYVSTLAETLQDTLALVAPSPPHLGPTVNCGLSQSSTYLPPHLFTSRLASCCCSCRLVRRSLVWSMRRGGVCSARSQVGTLS